MSFVSAGPRNAPSGPDLNSRHAALALALSLPADTVLYLLPIASPLWLYGIPALLLALAALVTGYEKGKP